MAAATVHAQTLPAVVNPELEKRVFALSDELRCLVCQNQTIADSNAELAVDLRNQVREKLEAGMTEKDVIAYMVERYGDFVLYRPPVKGTTWILWFGPFLLLIGGLGVLLMQLGKRQAVTEPAPDPELKRAAALLAGTDKKEKA
jgi:cytochrome c-type biogenesis protein CcmH